MSRKASIYYGTAFNDRPDFRLIITFLKKTLWPFIVLLVLTASCQPAPAPAPAPKTSLPPAATIPPAPRPINTEKITGTPAPSALPSTSRKWRITGIDVPALAIFDDTVKDYMQENNISQGALAVTYQDHLVLAHGYTWAGNESDLTQPTSLFRIASLSKPVTATAILKLVQDGKLSLDAKIVDILDFTPPAGKSIDPRLREVTVAHLLSHTAGWGYDPMFDDIRISQELGVPLPISQADIITYMSGYPITYIPGTYFDYSNYGYLLLGRIIEAASHQPYETYVKQNILKPLGITHMQLGHTLPDGRLPGEVTYHSDFTGPTVFDASGADVPMPYGAWNLENMDANGGWVANVIDLARFEVSFDRSGSSPVLSPDSIQRMFAAPPGTTEGQYYALGWFVVGAGSAKSYTWHGGRLDGTLGFLVRRADGVGWVVIFNQSNSRRDPKGECHWYIYDLLHQAAGAIETWPVHDLFQ
jgi:CubicO group peptidase (beta-lactamase class C family)